MFNLLLTLQSLKKSIAPFKARSLSFGIMGLVSAVSISVLSSTAFAEEATNKGQAQELFRGENRAIVACEAGRLDSCNFVAQNYLNLQYYGDAARYLTKICFSNDPNALKICKAAATLYTDPSYKISDYTEGGKIADYLCSKNDSYGCLLLSNMYFIGDHVEQDLVKASQYGQKACDLHDPIGCRQLAIITFSEAYVLKDSRIAELSFTYHQKACDLGEQDSCYDLQLRDEKLEQFKRFVENSRRLPEGQEQAPAQQ